jgi:hypothetical protein
MISFSKEATFRTERPSSVSSLHRAIYSTSRTASADSLTLFQAKSVGQKWPTLAKNELTNPGNERRDRANQRSSCSPLCASVLIGMTGSTFHEKSRHQQKQPPLTEQQHWSIGALQNQANSLPRCDSLLLHHIKLTKAILEGDIEPTKRAELETQLELWKDQVRLASLDTFSETPRELEQI